MGFPLDDNFVFGDNFFFLADNFFFAEGDKKSPKSGGRVALSVTIFFPGRVVHGFPR